MPPNLGACCAHDHDCGDAECGPAYSLYKHIDVARVTCLNESVPGSAKGVFRDWSARLDTASAPPLRSDDDDPELLLHVPFNASIKLKAISVIGAGEADEHPATLKVWTNREDLDFGSVADMAPLQEWSLQQDFRGEYEYPTALTKFNGVHSIYLYFPDNFGADSTAISFIGFKGEYTERRREAVTAVYELRPVKADQKVKGVDGARFGM